MYRKTLILVLYLVTIASCQNSLCSLDKYDEKCICEYNTNEDSHFPELTANCKWLDIESFPKLSRFPDELSNLDLTHNNIPTLSDGSSSESLLVLDLAYNEIDYIDHGFFDNLPNLKRLILSHNSINKLHPNAFDGLKQLEYLDLSFNKLTTLPDDIFLKLTNLRTLKLGYNNLGRFLEDSKNVFDSPMGLTKNLTYLNLDRTGLDLTPNNFFDGGEQLKHLSIADNYFDEIPTIPNSVSHLDFSGNNITSINVRHLNYHAMKVLKLNRLKSLTTIDQYAFYNMQNLEELYLDNCPKLKEFNGLAFGIIQPNERLSLRRFSASRSGLQRINATYFHLFKHLEFIDLQNNPFTCDCGILWMQLLNGSFEREENMRCLSPTNLRNVKIMKLEEKHLPSCLMSTKSIQLQKILIPILGVSVILLICLITYLVYMGPYLYRNYRGIGPESPYQHTVLREYNN